MWGRELGWGWGWGWLGLAGPGAASGAGQLGPGLGLGCKLWCAWLLAWNWAGISSHSFIENSKLMKMQFKFEIHTISIYPALEGLGFRV